MVSVHFLFQQQSILCAGKHGPSDLEICIDYVEEFSEFAVQHVTMYNAVSLHTNRFEIQITHDLSFTIQIQ